MKTPATREEDAQTEIPARETILSRFNDLMINMSTMLTLQRNAGTWNQPLSAAMRCDEHITDRMWSWFVAL